MTPFRNQLVSYFTSQSVQAALPFVLAAAAILATGHPTDPAVPAVVAAYPQPPNHPELPEPEPPQRLDVFFPIATTASGGQQSVAAYERWRRGRP